MCLLLKLGGITMLNVSENKKSNSFFDEKEVGKDKCKEGSSFHGDNGYYEYLKDVRTLNFDDNTDYNTVFMMV
jgi:hypothetical protein